jgi:predicted nucleic acid-binding Zn ribbon protein
VLLLEVEEFDPMPTYVYETIREDGQPGERFEVFQKMSDPVIEKHPVTGAPVRRVLTAPMVNTGAPKEFSDGGGGCGSACGCHGSGSMKN